MTTQAGTILGVNFESGLVILHCSVDFDPLDVGTDVSIDWWGPDGLIESTGRYVIEEGLIDTDTYSSDLTITELTVAVDNNTEYYCMSQVESNSSFSRSEFIVPADAQSDNVTVTVQG